MESKEQEDKGLEGRESERVRKEEVMGIACADVDCCACTFRPHMHRFIVGEKVQAGLQVKHITRAVNCH